jgi:electron transfer flavoprotein beta subunit
MTCSEQKLEIVVCAKQIPDPEAPPSAFKLDPEMGRIITSGIPLVINPFDENALEAGLRIREECEANVTVLSMAEKLSREVFRKALAAGADKLILLEDAHFEDLDSYSTAYVLISAIKKMGKYDIILTGRQAGDWDSGQTGLIIAEMLGIPSINLARQVKVENNNVIVEKVRPNSYELVKAKMPALVTASNEIGGLRYVPFKLIRQAEKKPIEVWGFSDLKIESQNLRKVGIFKYELPAMGRKCYFIEGNSLEEKGRNLALRLKEDIKLRTQIR